MKRLFLGALTLLSGILVSVSAQPSVQAQEAIRELLPYQEQECDPTRFRCLTPEQVEAMRESIREEQEREQQQRLEEAQRETGTVTGSGYSWSMSLTARDGLANWNCGAVAVNAEQGLLVQYSSQQISATRPARTPASANEGFQSNEQRENRGFQFGMTLLRIGSVTQPIEIGESIAGDNNQCWAVGAEVFKAQQRRALEAQADVNSIEQTVVEENIIGE